MFRSLVIVSRQSATRIKWSGVHRSNASRCISNWPAVCRKNRDSIIKAAGYAGLIGSTIYIVTTWANSPPPSTDLDKATGLPPQQPEPDQVEDLPQTVPYIIIGGGTASFAAVRAIRSNDPKSKVLVLSDSQHLPYMKPPLSKEMWLTPPEVAKNLQFRQFGGRDRPLAFEKPEFYFTPKQLASRETGGVCLIRGQRVERIDCENQIVFLQNGQSVHYDKCLIATGGEPQTHPVFEKSSPQVREKVMDYRNVDDFLKLQSQLPQMKNILIYGSGLLGTELAVSLVHSSKGNDLKVIQLFPEKSMLWKFLPQYLSRWLTDRILKEGVQVMNEVDIESADVKNDRLVIHLTNGSDLEVDKVVVTTRSDCVDGPNKRLAAVSGLEIHPKMGGFVTNAEMQARTNLWVAGDAACFYDLKLDERRRVEQHDQAVITGRMAGENMTGKHKPLKQQAMFWSDLTNEIGFEAVGLIDSSLETQGFFAMKEDQQSEEEMSEKSEKKETEDYDRGVVFYLRDKRVVGILLMNLFNRIYIARRVLKDENIHEDLADVAKWFTIYSDDEP